MMEYVTREEFRVLIARQDALDDDIHEIRLDIKQVRNDTHELVETYRTLSGGLKLLLLLGKIAASLTAVAGAITIFRNGWFK